MQCNCFSCSELAHNDSEGELPIVNTRTPEENLPIVPLPELNTEDLTLELQWNKPNGITLLENSRETRITSNTYVFLNMMVVHKTMGILPIESTFENGEPPCKLSSNPSFCTKCNRELISYSPKSSPFSYCRNSKKILGKFRIICSSNSHYVDKQLITITAHYKFRNIWLHNSISNVRINSKKPRDETDPASFKKRRKRKVVTQTSASLATKGGVVLEQMTPLSGPAVGNTLVTLRGKFSVDSEIVFGNVKLKPFLQQPDPEAAEEDTQFVDTLICYSPFGNPGSSVQVFVKDGECTSESKFYLYTTVQRKEPTEEKTKTQNDATVQQLRELTFKYNQLEQLVCSAMQQQQLASNSPNYRVSADSNLAAHIVYKSVLLDIAQAKSDLKDLENSMFVSSNTLNQIASIIQRAESVLKTDIKLNKDCLSQVFNPYPPNDIVPKDTERITKENQLLSKRIFNEFAIQPFSRGDVPLVLPFPQTFTRSPGLEGLAAAVDTLNTAF